MSKLICAMKNRQFVIFVALLIGSCIAKGQDCLLYVRSHVEIRTWTLTTKAIIVEKTLKEASITLYQGSKVVSETKTDVNGDFTVLTPFGGEYEMVISYQGCNSKKISVTATGVMRDAQKDNFITTFSIGGFVLSKPLPNIDYAGLQQSLVKIEYKAKSKTFEDDKSSTKDGLEVVTKIWEAENTLINNFCDLNKAGDEALLKQDCQLAKIMYEKAIGLIPDEKYPQIQLPKVGECFKYKEEISKKAEEAIAAKALEEKYAEALSKGDMAFNARNWAVAKESYNEAVKLKATEQYPKYRLVEVEKGIAEEEALKNNLAKANELKAKYAAAMKRAEDLFAKKLWKDAEDAYYEALGFAPNEKLPKTQIVVINKILSKESSGNDKNYKDAIARAGKLEPEYVNEIKRNYESALTYETDATYVKKASQEVVPTKKSENIKAMLAKYPAGLTEEIITGNGVVIIKRVLVKEGDVWVYQKKIFNWGGVTCFRDDVTITESIFENETRL